MLSSSVYREDFCADYSERVNKLYAEVKTCP